MFFRSRLSTVLVVSAVGAAIAVPTAAAKSRIAIPRIGVDVALASDLRRGPAVFYRDADTLAIAGHRTTYTKPFAHLPRLRRGDAIRVGRTTYLVRRTAVVRPTEVWVLNYAGLVLSVCHPAGSARYRFVVFAAAAHGA